MGATTTTNTRKTVTRKKKSPAEKVTKVTPKQQITLEIYRNKMGNISATCRAVGISRKTFHQWINTMPAFKEAVEEMKESVVDLCVSKLHENVMNCDQRAIEFALNSLGARRGFGPKSNQGIVLSDEGRKIVRDLKNKKTTLPDAIIDFTLINQQIPDGIKQLHAKSVAPLEDDSNEPRRTLTSEELEAKALEAFASIEKQRSRWLPERHREVIEIRESVQSEMDGRGTMVTDKGEPPTDN